MELRRVIFRFAQDYNRCDWVNDMFRIVSLIFVSACLFATSGCVRVGDNMEVIGENMTGGDCDWSRYVEGKNFCRHEKPTAIAYEPLYCYKSVGAVDCYNQPQPGRRLVGQNKIPNDMVAKSADNSDKMAKSQNSTE